MPNFAQFAPYLTHPLVLIGFAIWVLVGVLRALIRTNVIPTISQRAGGRAVQSLLRYFFYLALLTILLGFGLAFYQSHLHADPNIQRSEAERARLDGLVAMAQGFCQRSKEWTTFDQAAQRDAVLACGRAVDALAHSDAPDFSKEAALELLKNGDSQSAKALFRRILDEKTAEGKSANKEAAEAARQIGALAFVDNSTEALAAYQRAVELDPEDVEGLMGLGYLLGLIGQLSESEKAFEKAKSVSEGAKDRPKLADSFLYLGWIYGIRGEVALAENAGQAALAIDLSLDRKVGLAADYRYLGDSQMDCGDIGRAETMYKNALAIDEQGAKRPIPTSPSEKLEIWQMAQGYQRDLANLGGVYLARDDLAEAARLLQLSSDFAKFLKNRPGTNGNCSCELGTVYLRQGDLDRAEEMFRKALAVDESLGYKLGIAGEYSNLGDVYVAREKVGESRTMYKKSMELEESLGNRPGMAANFRALGALYMKRWFFGQSEAMLTKALEIDEATACKRRVAADFAALADLYHERGDLLRAETTYKRALKLLTEVGATRDVHEVQKRVDALAARRMKQM